jgi:hypothetical protein
VTLCVYAVVASGGRLSGRGAVLVGLTGERLEAMAAGRVTAIAGWVRRAPAASEASLRRHDAVIRTVWSKYPALLPARFGTTFNSVQDMTTAIVSQERSLRAGLARVRGRAQMTVRVLGIDGSTVPDPRSPIPDARSSGSSYLRARAAEAARARAVPGFEPLRHAVRPWVRDERVDKSGVVTVYHLVPRASVEAYRRALERAAAASGVRVLVSGPHPAYAFT